MMHEVRNKDTFGIVCPAADIAHCDCIKLFERRFIKDIVCIHLTPLPPMESNYLLPNRVAKKIERHYSKLKRRMQVREIFFPRRNFKIPHENLSFYKLNGFILYCKSNI